MAIPTIYQTAYDVARCQAKWKQGYVYCRLHPDIRNVHLETIEHHIKYKNPAEHKSELLKLQIDDIYR
jgi:hypothetical protein